MVVETQGNGRLVGLAPDLIDKGVAIMQYGDGTVLCISHDPAKALNLKLLLYMFEVMSGLKMNFRKSEIFPLFREPETFRERMLQVYDGICFLLFLELNQEAILKATQTVE